jgi:nucleoside-diphosphate-sugar epimerase
MVRRLADEDLRVLVRDADAFYDRFPDVEAQVFEGDLEEQEDIDQAIDDADTVFHCVGRPLFDWGDLIGHTRRVITAAEEEVKKVDIVFPGNVLVYGDVGPGTVRENQAHDPGTRKGTIRVNIERQLREANTRGDCRTTVARFPDLYGPDVHSRCQHRIFPAVLKGETVGWPGDLEADREFIFVDDAADAMVRLAESKVSWGKAWHVPGPGSITARDFIEMAFKAAGTEPDLRESIGMAMSFSDRFSKDPKEEKEILFSFLRPVTLDGAQWKKAYGPPPSTPYQEGIERTVEWWRQHPVEK